MRYFNWRRRSVRRSPAWVAAACLMFACAGGEPIAGEEGAPCSATDPCHAELSCERGTCRGESPGGSPADAGAAADAGLSADGGGHLDAGVDGGLRVDGGNVADAGAPTDGGRVDAGVPGDGGTVGLDGGATQDAGATADGGITRDGGIAGDGGATADGGIAQDGGFIPDAGTGDGGARGAWIGGACDVPARCDFAMADCLRTEAGVVWPGGTCSLACTQSCPDRAGQPITFCGEDEAAMGRCVSRCDGGADCRPGYLCELRGRFNEPTTVQRVCVPPTERPDGGAPSVYPARRTAALAAIDTAKLATVLQNGGATVPAGAKILAVKVGGVPDAPRYEYFSYRSTGWDDAFWPASAIKLFAALGALEALENRGFSVGANITYQETGGYSGPFKTILDAALIPSDNTAYDRLMFFAGFDEMNTQFLTPARGFTRTVLTRRYGIAGSLRASPPIALREGTQTANIPARTGTGTYDCANEGNCTNAFELAEAIRRVGMHERLGDGERFHLRLSDLSLLRSALATNTGTWIYPGAQAVFGATGALIYHKTGLAGGWKIDNAFLREKATGAEYVLTIIVPDSTSDAAFNALARVILAAFKAGTLTATVVTP